MRLLKLAGLAASTAAVAAIAIKLLGDRAPRVRRMTLMLTRHGAQKAMEENAAAAPAATGERQRPAKPGRAKSAGAPKRVAGAARPKPRRREPTA